MTAYQKLFYCFNDYFSAIKTQKAEILSKICDVFPVKVDSS